MTSWKDILSDYRSYLVIERALSVNSVSSYLSDLAKLAGTYKDKSPEELSGEDLSAFIAQQAAAISKRSQSRLISALKSFFGFMAGYRSTRLTPSIRPRYPGTYRWSCL